MKIIKYFQVFELLAGVAFVFIALLAHSNTLFCYTNKESCGMVEPLISLWGFLFGSALLVSGMSLNYSGKKRWLGHSLLVLVVFYAVTIH
ncbi:hypothetical protein J3L16_15795 [Alteromonas sp. 5E99-2]|uniref:hypothetical protein n=1 Tax=Alteromonas sp. 5E99-2 TaxID=2817683 RepID=UPI001A992984|nr:hypothetical protein [Alteromonas sp. 5E99-2]MBO1257145.1 hypothetical protein [Alteromonas sp. 5E99-2]